MIRPLLAALFLAPAQAGAFSLSFPLDCTLNQTCFIQQYTDRDPSSKARDFTCGPLSYDGHKGTDFALPTLADMERGVAVRAAASGTVRATRDGMEDVAQNTPNAPEITNRDCGNAVVITHPDGWESQYCHLKKGSVAVKSGQTVTAGTPLGQIGLSGNTEFPHLHLSLRHNRAIIDPFSPGTINSCNDPRPSLWSPALPYQPGGLLDLGFATAIPSFSAVKSGTLGNETLPATAPALVLWAHIFGTQAGDTLEITISGPQGDVLSESIVLEKTQARAMRAVGKRLRASNWPSGTYGGTAIMTRAGKALGKKSITVDIVR